MQRISVCVRAHVCVREEKKNPQGAVVHQRGLKKDSERAYTPSHTHRNSIDRKGNKKTGEFGGGGQIKEM